jgi:two-component system sensor histidine kinase YesM
MIVGLLFILLTVPLSILLAFRISRPIIDLAGTMQKTDFTSFSLHPVQGRDEIGLLEQGYNSLMERIRELVEEEYQRELELRDARILALQSQINPHFLHNTLQLIGGMALSRSAPEIYEVTRIMGELLRYSLSSEGDLVSLREELNHTKNYLFIQEQRFEDRCSIKIVVDESVLDSPLPRFTLQPLVENSFDHGLQNRQGPWNLEIRIKRMGDKVGLMVYDNGLGVPRDRLEKIRRELAEPFSLGRKKTGPEEPAEKRGIGLANVNARIRLVFGPGFGLRIFSWSGGGTLAVVMVPLENKKDTDHV